MTTATLTRAVQTQWGLFTKGCTVKVVARDDETAVVDFGIERHMYWTVPAESITRLREAA